MLEKLVAQPLALYWQYRFKLIKPTWITKSTISTHEVKECRQDMTQAGDNTQVWCRYTLKLLVGVEEFEPLLDSVVEH